MKKNFYPLCALLLSVGLIAACQSSSKKKDAKDSEVVASFDTLAPNPFITHMYTADPSAHYGPTDVCMCMPRTTLTRLAVAT